MPWHAAETEMSFPHGLRSQSGLIATCAYGVTLEVYAAPHVELCGVLTQRGREWHWQSQSSAWGPVGFQHLYSAGPRSRSRLNRNETRAI